MIPNGLDVIKAGLGIFIYQNAWVDWTMAFWCYAVAVFIDAVDGTVARYLNAETRIGKNLVDPLSDFVMTATASAGLLLQPGKGYSNVWTIGLPVATSLLGLKLLKYQGWSLTLQYLSISVLPMIYLLTTVVQLNFYAHFAFNLQPLTHVVSTLLVVSIATYFKNHRLIDWKNGRM